MISTETESGGKLQLALRRPTIERFNYHAPRSQFVVQDDAGAMVVILAHDPAVSGRRHGYGVELPEVAGGKRPRHARPAPLHSVEVHDQAGLSNRLPRRDRVADRPHVRWTHDRETVVLRIEALHRRRRVGPRGVAVVQEGSRLEIEAGDGA